MDVIQENRVQRTFNAPFLDMKFRLVSQLSDIVAGFTI